MICISLCLQPLMPIVSPPAQSRLPSLLTVEDDVEIAALLQRYFSAHGFEVRGVVDGAGMRATLANEEVDIVLLDLGLPGEDGVSLMRYLRENWNGAVIIVTGRGDSVDRVVGLELGADDYVTKPFDLRELLARVRTVMRRTRAATAHPGKQSVGDGAELRFAGFTLDTAARTLRNAVREEIPLTSGEYELLCAFVAHPDRVLSRDELMNQLHGRDTGPYDRAIDVQVGRLRRKLDADAENPQLIKSVRGAGYVFTGRVERS